MNKEFASVDQVIRILQDVSDSGRGDYTVGCNSEYYLAKPDEQPEINDKTKDVDLGGYC